MRNTAEPAAHRTKPRALAALVVTLTTLGVLLVPTLVGAAASATPRHLAATTCTSYPSGACPTTTSGPTTIPISVASTPALGAASSPSSTNGHSLAFTGADVALLVLAAVLLILIGYAIVRVNRRRRHAG